MNITDFVGFVFSFKGCRMNLSWIDFMMQFFWLGGLSHASKATFQCQCMSFIRMFMAMRCQVRSQDLNNWSSQQLWWSGICLRWLFTLWHGNSPSNQHLRDCLLFPSILCESKEWMSHKLGFIILGWFNMRKRTPIKMVKFTVARIA